MVEKNNLNILIIEDDDFQLKLIESLLLIAGYTFVSVSDARTAYEKLEQEKFNLVISDINLPGGVSGFNLVKSVRDRKDFHYIPFIFVTGRSSQNDIARAIENGADDYIIKPIDRDMLLAKVESLISKKAKLFSFSERPVQGAAQLQIDFVIEGVSEQAVQLLSPIPLPNNYKFKIQAAMFEEIGITPPLLRVTNSESLGELKKQNRIRANFIGLTEIEMSSIRKWVILNAPKSYKRA